MEVKDELQLTITVIGMFVGPWLAVRLSLRQFRSQKWWERQQDAYTKLLESFSVIQSLNAELYDSFMRSEVYTPSDSLRQKAGEASHEIDKYAATGAYLISEVAAKALRVYLSKTVHEPEDIEHEYHSRVSDEAMKCIEVLKAEAKRELKAAR